MAEPITVDMRPGEYPEDSEVGAPRVVHNHYNQSKSGNGGNDASRLNTILLAALIAIIGFVGVNVWNMNDRLARVETNVSTLLARP
jgi:hypothetical protein